jgi:hypothetical protein
MIHSLSIPIFFFDFGAFLQDKAKGDLEDNKLMGIRIASWSIYIYMYVFGHEKIKVTRLLGL